MESYCLMGLKFQFGKMKNLGDSSDDCPTMCMYLIPLNCTIRMAEMVKINKS